MLRPAVAYSKLELEGAVLRYRQRRPRCSIPADRYRSPGAVKNFSP